MSTPVDDCTFTLPAKRSSNLQRSLMRLADFILRDMEPILAAWEAFASVQLPAARHMDSLALRDHARQILEAVAKDLSTSQSREAQIEKSLGRAPILIGTPRPLRKHMPSYAHRAASTSTSWRRSTAPFAPAFFVCGAMILSRKERI
jgi:hypothetical protein